MYFIECLFAVASFLPILVLANPAPRPNPIKIYKELKARQQDVGVQVGTSAMCDFCKYLDNPQSPLHAFNWCTVHEFVENETKYFGMCYNTEADVVKQKDNIKAIDQAYVDEVTNFLAYFTNIDKPSFCAGQGTVDDVSPDVARAVSSAFWYTSLERETAHQLIVGLNHLVSDRQDLQVNLGHSKGVGFARLTSLAGDLYQTQAPITFYDDDDQILCHQERGPGWKPNTPAGYAAGWCTFHLTHYQVPSNPKDDSERQYAVQMALYDANGLLIGWHDKTFSAQPVGVTSKLPYMFIITTPPPYHDQDAIYFDYAGQHFGSNDQAHQCNFGAYDGNKREGDCGFTC